jgi:hypothetical protein
MRLPFMSANPQFYDYLHVLNFKDDYTIELVDGAGQLINTVGHGRYAIRDLSPSTAEVTFFELVEVDPYHNNRKIHDIPAFTVHVTKEDGVFFYAKLSGRSKMLPLTLPCSTKHAISIRLIHWNLADTIRKTICIIWLSRRNWLIPHATIIRAMIVKSSHFRICLR